MNHPKGRGGSEGGAATRPILWLFRSIAVLWLVLLAVAPTVAGADPSDAPSDLDVLKTPQIADPLRPLSHVRAAAAHLSVRAAVVTVPDPLETQLGRAFDIQLAALIRAFHWKDYVLDGFALTWNPSLAGSDAPIPWGGSRNFDRQHRSVPSVLVFRRDLWRGTPGPGEAGAEYFVAFLVGESPTFGVHPTAFRAAATCAARLDGRDSADLWSQPCNGTRSPSETRGGRIDVIGPAFSGSMESVALALGELLAKDPELRASLGSPSASVKSNTLVAGWADRIAGQAGRVSYRSFALSLEDQLKRLAQYRQEHRIAGRVTILAEESTFGFGVEELIRANREAPGAEPKRESGDDPWQDFLDNARVAGFPQNIAAIRAERSGLARQRTESLRKTLQPQSRLLELDLSGVGAAVDRPPAYQRKLSSRSDELMLYGLFDALRVWSDPSLVVIVATDIRDRLFLLNEVRKSLPRALPVLLEMDYLAAHPDYRKIGRGAIVVPSGDTLIVMRQQRDASDGSGSGNPPKARGESEKGKANRKHRLSFAADYAANTFRATLALIDGSDPVGEKKPSLVVATLAGFQSIDDTQGSSGGRSRLLAADGRLALEGPLAVLLFLAGLVLSVFAVWLTLHGRAHLVMLSPVRHLHRFPGLRVAEYWPCGQDPEQGAQTSPSLKRLGPWFSAPIAGLAILSVGLATTRLVELLSGPRDRSWDLAHGRDELSLFALFLLFLCLAIFGGWRLYLWERRRRAHTGWITGSADTSGWTTQLALFVAALVLGSLLLAFWVQGIPTAVDSPIPSLLIDATLIALGSGFLAALWTESRRFAWFAQLLAPIADLSRDPSAGPPGATDPADAHGDWANPVRLGALPQSPFGLCLRERDLTVLLAYPDRIWGLQARALLKGQWPTGCEARPGFRVWQSRLAAELRYGAVALRSLAWCAILAPTAVLLGMGLYPPACERTLTTMAVLLVLAGFALVMYTVIELDQHPLLGRMFTRSGNRLSVGGVVGALWGKLAAAALILVPVLFPDTMSALYSLLASIDSLR